MRAFVPVGAAQRGSLAGYPRPGPEHQHLALILRMEPAAIGVGAANRGSNGLGAVAGYPQLEDSGDATVERFQPFAVSKEYTMRYPLQVALVICGLMLAALMAPPSGLPVVTVAMEIGVTPESLTIAGFDTASGETILAQIEGAHGLRTALATKRQQAAAAASSVTALLNALGQAPENQQLHGQYQAAANNLNGAQTAMAQLRQHLFEKAMEGMAAEKVEIVQAWREGARYRVAPEFRVRLRPPEEWRAIEQALRRERRAAALGQPLDEDDAQLLAEVRADPLVVQAGYYLQANLAEMEAVFAQP